MPLAAAVFALERSKVFNPATVATSALTVK